MSDYRTGHHKAVGRLALALLLLSAGASALLLFMGSYFSTAIEPERFPEYREALATSPTVEEARKLGLASLELAVAIQEDAVNIMRDLGLVFSLFAVCSLVIYIFARRSARAERAGGGLDQRRA